MLETAKPGLGLSGFEIGFVGSGDCPTMYLAWRRLEVDAELRGLR